MELWYQILFHLFQIFNFITMNKFLSSSANPKELSLTVIGLITYVVPIVALIVNTTGGQFSNEDVRIVIETTTNLVATIGTVASSVMVVYGLLRKVFLSIKK